MRVTRRVVASAVVALVVAMSAPLQLGAVSQVPQLLPPGGQAGAGVPVTLQLTVVISRFNGEKQVGSLPFMLMVIPGADRDGNQTNLQTGANVPVPQTTFGENKLPQMSYSYRQFGTNISSSASTVDAGVFNVSLTVTDSQLLSDAPDQAQYAGNLRLPRYQSFTSSNRLILRDRQNVQYTAATDKTSGEVIKLDVRLIVIK